MSRPDSVDSLMLCHLDWDSDHLVVDEQNPLQPCICPVLALAVLCFSKPMRYKLFDGEFNSDRAGSNLRELIRSMTGPEMLLLGNDIVACIACARALHHTALI